MNTSSAAARPLATLSWAVYVGIAWTWCIGMFLPVILFNRFGLGGYVAFVVPNVVGAAAMGWVLARPGRSERITAEHRTACLAFSAVTVAFQAYFLVWMGRASVGRGPVIPPSWAWSAALAGTAVGLVARRRTVVDLALAWAALAVSAAVAVVGLRHPHFGHADAVVPAATPVQVAGLAASCVFGFGLCPYLDLTFHRTVRHTAPAASRTAFGVGFGVVFLAMILVTPLYVGDFFFPARPTGVRYGSFGLAGLTTWVALHFCVQIGFTWAAHLRAIPRPRWDDAGLWASAAVLVVAGAVALRQPIFHGFGALRPTGDLVYRLFISFYGLTFPAYVWLCMVPLRGRPAPGPTRPALLVWAATLAVAGPLFWLGFIADREQWLFAGVAVVLLARLAVPNQREPTTEPPAVTVQPA